MGRTLGAFLLLVLACGRTEIGGAAAPTPTFVGAVVITGRLEGPIGGGPNTFALAQFSRSPFRAIGDRARVRRAWLSNRRSGR